MGSWESKEPRLVGLMTLKVAAKSNPSTVAGAIANNVRDGKSVEIVAMGPESINNTVKAIAIARGLPQGRRDGRQFQARVHSPDH